MFKSRLASLAFIFLVSTVQVQIANGDCESDMAAMEADPNILEYSSEVSEAYTSCLLKDDCEPDYSKAKKVCENDLDGDYDWFLTKLTTKCADGIAEVVGVSVCIPLSCAEERLAELKEVQEAKATSPGCTAEISFEDFSAGSSTGFSPGIISGGLIALVTGATVALV